MSLGIFSNDTATDPVPVRDSIVPGKPNYSADWRVQSSSPGEVVLVNIRADGAITETLRIAYTDIKDIFKGTNIVPSEAGYATLSSYAGASVLVQLSTTAVDDDGNLWPISAHMVLKVPKAVVTGGDMVTLISRLLGHLYDTGANDPNDRLIAMVRGALQPKDL